MFLKQLLYLFSFIFYSTVAVNSEKVLEKIYLLYHKLIINIQL